MLNKFELLMPCTLDEALHQYAELGGRCKIVAGGTDVFVKMHSGEERYALLMDIKNLDELKGVEYTRGKGLVIGALTTHRCLERLAVIKEVYPALYDGVSQIGCVQTRYRGTIGGNICNAVPSADTLGPLLALNASLVVQSVGGTREIPFDRFFLGPKKTALLESELLIKILVPDPAPCSSSCYTRFTRRNAMDLALLGATADLTSQDKETCTHIRVSLTAAAPTVIRAGETEKFLTGRPLTADVMRQAGEIASSEAKPRSSWRSSEQYRREILKVIVPRTISAALDRIRKGGL